MLFSIEGISSVGKTTLQKELLKLDNSIIIYDGLSMLATGPDDWDKSVSLEHFILDRLNRLNLDKIIVADRLFSGGVYELQPEKWIRFFSFHYHPRIIYLEASEDILKERFTKDVNVLKTKEKYDKMLEKFKHIRIDTSDKTPEVVAAEVYAYIKAEMQNAKVKQDG